MSSKQNSFKCWNCGVLFSDRQALNRHRKKHRHFLDTMSAEQFNSALVNNKEVNIEKDTEAVNTHLEATLQELEKIVGNQRITAANILLFALNLEQTVERYQDLTGPEKKSLVIKVFKEYFNNHGGDSNGLLQILPNFIDVSVSLDRGDATIKLDMEEATVCCASLLSLCFNSAKKSKPKN